MAREKKRYRFVVRTPDGTETYQSDYEPEMEDRVLKLIVTDSHTVVFAPGYWLKVNAYDNESE